MTSPMMQTLSDFSVLNAFPSGLVVTTIQDRRIIFANRYYRTVFELEQGEDGPFGNSFTPASKIMLESYVVPMLLNQQQCNEVQLTVKSKAGELVPVMINAQTSAEDADLIYWSVALATRRDKLYKELHDLRKQLQLRAEALQVLAQTDELTGLANRRAFLQHGNMTVKQASRVNASCAFLMIDIDNFKEVNDSYGHAVGDEILRQLGSIFRRCSRESDRVARLGGEEFAIITMCSSLQDAQKFAQKLIDAVSAEPIQGLKITVSIGLAVARASSLEELFKYADEQLYLAKSNGKNQLASSLITLPGTLGQGKA